MPFDMENIVEQQEEYLKEFRHQDVNDHQPQNINISDVQIFDPQIETHRYELETERKLNPQKEIQLAD